MKTLWSLIGLGGGKKPNSKEVMLDLGGNVVLDRHLLPDYEPGVVRTRVGYCGGTKESPSYYDLGDQTESVQIEFDTTKISYEDLLQVFWEGHNPVPRASRQYMSAIFYHDERQKLAAEKSRDEYLARKGLEKVSTQILPVTVFTLAEDYHQKYYLQNKQSLMKGVKASSTSELVNSFTAARLNGFAGGYGTVALAQREMELYALPSAACEALLDLAAANEKRTRRGCS